MLGFLLRAVIAALGLWIATAWVPGVSIDGPRTLILAGVLLGVVNAIVRPIAIVLTFPMTIVSLGLFLLVINAGMVALVAWMLPGMHVAGFWSAFWSAVIVSLVGMLGAALLGPRGKVEVIVKRR
jgi:putative membrane protein